MVEQPPDRISRADLSRVLKVATELQARSASIESFPVAEAERIAAEVGIDPSAFRAAMAAVRATDVETEGRLGPRGLLTATTSLSQEVGERDAVHMIVQAQLSFPEAGTSIETPTDGIWRMSQKGSWVQIAARNGLTTLSAGSDRRFTKVGLVGGAAVTGAMAGTAILTTLSVGLIGSVEAAAISQVVGFLGGGAGGLSVGVKLWQGAARRTYRRALEALDSMRSAAIGSTATDDLDQ